MQLREAGLVALDSMQTFAKIVRFQRVSGRHQPDYREDGDFGPRRRDSVRGPVCPPSCGAMGVPGFVIGSTSCSANAQHLPIFGSHRGGAHFSRLWRDDCSELQLRIGQA